MYQIFMIKLIYLQKSQNKQISYVQVLQTVWYP